MTKFEIRRADKIDLRHWFEGDLPPVSMPAQVLDVGGELVGIWGVQFFSGQMLCFSRFNAVAKANKRAMVAVVKSARKMLQEYPYVIAFADKDEPTADGFLRHTGFRYAGSSPQGEVYEWLTHYQ
jgi:hypothetical protein